MTADVEITEAGESDKNGFDSTLIAFPAEIADIFEFLSLNDKIVFKSQQIDDPELQRSEKIDIAKEIYSKNRQTFLMRFGCFLNAEQLTNFANLLMLEHIDKALKIDESYEEMRLLLTDLQHKLHTRELAVKNRRYVALQNLIEKGEYFSEYEMMGRAPELYQELVGQYMTKAEKDIRDSYDVKNTSFSGILWHTVQRKEMQELLTAADENNRRDDSTVQQQATGLPNVAEAQINETDSSDECTNDAFSDTPDNSVDVNVPAAFRQQWGNFDNEKVACSESRERKTIKPKQSTTNTIDRSLITAGERNLLRQEFVDIMYEQFLAGKDKDFDYTQVDDNSQLDDLKQLEQDKEDAYFESSDNDEVEETSKISANALEHADESEDELDIYMSHLNKHHSL